MIYLLDSVSGCTNNLHGKNEDMDYPVEDDLFPCTRAVSVKELPKKIIPKKSKKYILRCPFYYSSYP
jgi:hypothetical protein